MIKCSGVTTLSIPRQLDKLKHLLVDIMDVEMVEFHAGDLTHFEYQGPVIPIVHHGCSKLEKATIMFEGSKGLSHVFNDVPIILGVNTLSVQAHVLAYEEVTWCLFIYSCLLTSLFLKLCSNFIVIPYHVSVGEGGTKTTWHVYAFAASYLSN